MNITEAVGNHLDDLLRRIGAPQGAVIRLVPQSGCLSLHADTARPDDLVFISGGRAVLVVDRQIDAMFSDKTLDIRTTNDGMTLVLVPGS